MSSPHRLIHDMVDSEIRHRSRFSADNNVDFYQLKLLRLEKDFMAVQGSIPLIQMSSTLPGFASELRRITRSSMTCSPSRMLPF